MTPYFMQQNVTNKVIKDNKFGEKCLNMSIFITISEGKKIRLELIT